MRVLVLSALARDTGSWLRARSIARSLEPHARVVFLRAPSRSRPFLLEVVLSAPGYLARVLASDADCLLAVKPFPNATLPLLVARWLGRLPGLRRRCIVVDVDDRDDAFFEGWRGRLVRLVQRPAPRRFDLVTYHNENLRTLLEEDFGVPGTRLARLPQGVDLTVFHPRQDPPVEPGSLLYVGHLNVACELPWILEAVREVQRGRRAPLTVAGGGPCRARFQELARSLGVEARFTGQLSTEEVALQIARAEVCLVYYGPSEANRHRSSMKLRECLAMGKKVVCNDFDELAGFAAWTYASSSDPAAFVAAVETALERGDGREADGARYVREHLDWRVLGAELFERLRALVR